VIAWRLMHKKHVAPDGEGARRYGGRWNRPGTPIVYTSGTLSLAVLEFLVHVDSDIFPDSLVRVRATIPESVLIQTIRPSDLPRNWKDKIIPVAVQDLGTSWANAATSAVLKVPSVVIEHEWNYVLNPRHPDFNKIIWDTAVPFSFDPRLLR
jgi:RES domain-containing protein